VIIYTLGRRNRLGDLPAVQLVDEVIPVRVADLDGLFPPILTTRPEERYGR
jgi:hypothetical protein